MLMRRDVAAASNTPATNQTRSTTGGQSNQCGEVTGGPPNRELCTNDLPNKSLSSTTEAARMRTAEKMGAASARATSNAKVLKSRLRCVGSGEVRLLLPRMSVIAPEMPPTEVIHA